MTTDMHHLTQDQKDRLESQIVYAAALIRASTPTRDWKTKLSAFLAHPAFLALLGSGLLALIVAWYQQDSATAQSVAEHARLFHEKRLTIAATLPAQLHKTGMLLANLQGMKPSPGAPIKIPEGWTHGEYVALYKATYESYLNDTHHFGRLMEVRAWFSCDPAVVTLAEQANNLFQNFEDLGSNELSVQKIIDFKFALRATLRDLTIAMFASVAPRAKCS
jgi:hypothetical protein